MTQSKNLTVDENQSVELVCSIVQNDQQAASNTKLIWINSKTNRTLQSNEEYTVGNRRTSILKIKNVTRNDAATYLCQIEEKANLSIEFCLLVKCLYTLLLLNK